MKNYAAVIIPTLNRIDHLRTLINSLKQCKYSKNTDVYIGLDYPPSELYRNGYEKVKDYLLHIDQNFFKSLNVYLRKENYGYFKNLNDLRKNVMCLHNTFIQMDDDIEVSENFLEYINSALDYYENDDNVIAVSGYSYPIKWNKSKGSNSLKTNYVAAEWGIGFWKDKFLKLEKILSEDYLYKNFISAYKSGKVDLMIDAGIKDYSTSILNPYSKDSLLRLISDVSMRIYLPIAEKYIIMPTLSHTMNHGFDGSGLYCGKKSYIIDNRYADTYDYDSQPIDNSGDYRFIPSEDNNIVTNRNLLNVFDRRDQKEMHHIRKRLKVYVLCGPKVYSKYLKARTFYRSVKIKLFYMFKRD